LKNCYENQVWLKYDKNNGYFEDICTIITVSHWILLRMRNVSDRICRENQNGFYVH
jgi:hypothetical protein